MKSAGSHECPLQMKIELADVDQKMLWTVTDNILNIFQCVPKWNHFWLGTSLLQSQRSQESSIFDHICRHAAIALGKPALEMELSSGGQQVHCGCIGAS